MNTYSSKSCSSFLLTVCLIGVFNVGSAIGASTTTLPNNSPSETLQGIFERVERSNKDDVRRYEQLKSRKQSQLSEVNEQVSSQQFKLNELNENNARLEEDILRLQQKLRDKQKQVEAARSGIIEVIDLTSAQQNNFIANNQPLATWFNSRMPKPIEKSDFNITTINTLWLAMIQQISESSEPREYIGDILLPSGKVERASIQQIGAFSQFSKDFGWLSFDGARQQWQQITPQPQFNRTPDQWVIDPNFGLGFIASAKQPKWYESYKPAGIIGLLITFIAVIGFSIGLVRLITLTKEKRAVTHQASRLSALSNGNILGRVLIQLKECATEQEMEDVVDANVSREMPWLHKGIGTLAVLAAIAPLMGLLGTVGGMIETFSVITAQGVTDGDLLSGGIAEALLTTKLGLLVAVPLLIIHCLVKNQAQQLAEILEYQVTSLVVDIRYGKREPC
ncbi:MotA/TolQ/ExbB proton channel family protein [Vibrio gallaecicus]|uniref:MotA/TolQ/ExbB proton channel family protein n=1 Tax=Vibrio gallaecicus TaxID=552386 RepID=A0ABV4NGX1_9VIBR